MGELAKRVMVAVVALPLLALLSARGAWTSSMLFAAAAALACWEYYRMVFGSIPAVAWLAIACGAAMAIVPAIGANDQGTLLLAIVAATSALVWVDHLFRGPHASAPERIGHITAGLLFCSLSAAPSADTRREPHYSRPWRDPRSDRQLAVYSPVVWLLRVTLFPR